MIRSEAAGAESSVESAEDEGERGAHRRRGATLEEAILRTAWDELEAVGYASLTMEGVAARAKTSRAVIYRRWKSRPELVLAAMRARSPMLTGPVPDTGSLREDVLTVLRRMSQRLSESGLEVRIGLISEYFRDLELYSYLLTQISQVGAEVMMTILGHAAQRGEVRLDRITRRMATLPVDLARNELLVTREPLTEAASLEIVDDVFLPLVRRGAGAEGEG